MLFGKPVYSHPHSSFTERLLQANHLDKRDFHDWSLQPGMLFASDSFWWGAKEARPNPHEGLDLSTYIDSSCKPVDLGAGTLIPALYAGQVVATFTDFMGQSILISHPQMQGAGQFHSIYAHVSIETTVTIGYHCAEGEIISRIVKSMKSGIPSHLHLSTLWLSGTFLGEINWPTILHATNIQFCDPLNFIHRIEQKAITTKSQ
jgi:murein DD-endopeptidase MepM/ murein hydrolase activator NlpD